MTDQYPNYRQGNVYWASPFKHPSDTSNPKHSTKFVICELHFMPPMCVFCSLSQKWLSLPSQKPRSHHLCLFPLPPFPPSGHIKSVTKSSLNHLLDISWIRLLFSTSFAFAPIQANITSCLDHQNNLFTVGLIEDLSYQLSSKHKSVCSILPLTLEWKAEVHTP